MSPEDPLDSPLGLSSTREEDLASYGDLEGSPELGRRSMACSLYTKTPDLYTKTPDVDTNCYGDVSAVERSPLLKILIEAEGAANSAAVQLMSFKDAMEEEFADSRQSASDKRRITRQRGLLLEKLDVFKRINKSVRQQLKELQEAEAGRHETDKQIDVLLKKITQAEIENVHLKRDLNNTEKRVVELTNQRRKEQENTESSLHTTKSGEAVRAHLQGQLRHKEADNNRLTVQLRTLERTLTEQRMEIDDLRGSISALSDTAVQERETLKKATRAQKQRAERFEAAVDKCYTQLREKDMELADAHAERNSWRRQQEEKTEEREQLDAQIQLLKSQMADLTARLQRERDEFTAANDVVMQRVERLHTDNGDLNLHNAMLKETTAELEEQLACSKAALSEEMTVSQERKNQAEHYQNQVAALQVEVDDLRIKCEHLLRETENEKLRKDAEVEKVRQELQGRLVELELYPELLSATEQSLTECQEKLQRSERKYSEKSQSLRQLQVQVDNQGKKLKSSVEMKDSIHEANSQLQENVECLQKKMEELQQENQELVRRLAGQEEALNYSNRQLDQRSTECHALNRQLEAALTDVKQQVTKMKDKAVSREGALQAKILELEAERSRREAELKLLRQSRLSAEKQFEVRLRDLQLSLDQSESHKQSIQNYVDFLKNSYSTMFDEGPTLLTFGSSYFPK